MIQTAFVHIWNKRVGAVAWSEQDGTASFEYDPDFAATGWELSPIAMRLSDLRMHRFPEHRNTSTFKGLPGLLADVLPDKYGNALINQWLVRNQRPANSINPVETLCFIGERAMGALEFEPTLPRSKGRSIKLEMNELIDITSKILAGRQEFLAQLQSDQEKALQAILQIGTSAGGARAKALIAFNKKTQEIRSGQANAPRGFDHYLIKFDGIEDEQFGTSQGYGRVEMAYYKMALDAGIEMMESELLEEHGRAHFMTKRFDRLNGKDKVHVQSFCALRHYDFMDIDPTPMKTSSKPCGFWCCPTRRQNSSLGEWSSMRWPETATTTPRILPSPWTKAASGCSHRPLMSAMPIGPRAHG